MDPAGSGSAPSTSTRKEDAPTTRYPKRAPSPVLEYRRHAAVPASTAYATSLASKGALRTKEKFVALPEEEGEAPEDDDPPAARGLVAADEQQQQHMQRAGPSGQQQQQQQGQGNVALYNERGRITVVCVAESFDRKQLEILLLERHPECHYQAYPEVMYVRTPHGERDAPGEVFFFDYGVVAFWGMTEMQEQTLLMSAVAAAGVDPLEEDEKQVDELLFVYSQTAQPHIQNDTITINRRQAADHQVKMGISHGLAQSSKLSIYEERMVELVEEVRHIPREMATYGSVSMSRQQMSQLMGKVFLLKASVHLMSTVLDTPEFFRRAPDQLQVLYERVCEYQQLEARLELLDARFVVLQKMLSIWTDHSAHHHLARLDIVVVLLILVQVVMAGAEVFGFLMRHRGWQWHGPKLWQLIWGHHHPWPWGGSHS